MQKLLPDWLTRHPDKRKKIFEDAGNIRSKYKEIETCEIGENIVEYGSGSYDQLHACNKTDL